YQQLVQDILSRSGPDRQMSVVVLDARRNGLEQITDILAGYSHLDAVHIISHGEPGDVQLGNRWGALSDLNVYEHDVRDWCAALPTAKPDSYAVNANTALTVTAGAGILANDVNPLGGLMTATLITGTAHGTLSLSADGSFTYTPNANFTGTDTFTYQDNVLGI